MSVTLLVFFEDPFWVGIVERREGGRLRAARVVFGAEPSDREVYAWVLESFDGLRFSPPVEDGLRRAMAQNPKRRQRQAMKAAGQGVGTKSQQALQAAREASAAQRGARAARQREAEAQRRFDLRQEKKKAKHRGR
ncbi:MAG: YjdF family protein [Eubacteriales bacterium]|mgnify:FL=1|nr:YjdF family protein [Eubacteriales bacterium]